MLMKQRYEQFPGEKMFFNECTATFETSYNVTDTQDRMFKT